MKKKGRRSKQQSSKRTLSPLLAALEQGQHYQSAGRLGDAENLYRQVLAAVPGHPHALYLLASVARHVGRHENALQLLESALVAAPDNPNYLLSRGVSFAAMLRWQEAMADYRRVIAICPDAAEAYNNLGNSLHAQGELDEAVEAFRRALALNPDYLDARVHLGHALKMTGDLGAAETAYRQVLAKAPERADVYRSLSSIKRFQDIEDSDLQQMQSLCQSESISATSAMHLHFALGKAAEDLQQFSSAFQHWRTANQLVRASYEYDIETDVELVCSIKTVFESAVFAQPSAGQQIDARPIFIVGLPRSGTSLVEQILASHTQVAGAGEVGVLRQLIDSQLEFPTVACCDSAMIDKLAQSYLQRMSFFNTCSKERGTDKTLFNFFYIGMIRLMFPQASVICCWRDPLDTGLSCYRQYFPDIHRFVNDLYEIGRFYGLFADLMAHWHEQLPGFILDLQYEELVADQQGQTRRLLEFCGLPWEDRCLDFHLTKRAVKTISTTQVRQPLFQTAVAQWKNYSAELDELRRGLGCSSFDVGK